MDSELPFYYWTANERFHDEEESFNEIKPQCTERLHKLRVSKRDNSSVFAAGRAFLPARDSSSIRQKIHRFDVGLPPVPTHLLPAST